MKRAFLLVILTIVLVFCLTGCGCEHEWKEATCTDPRTCSLCQKTEGNPLGHVWQDATCLKPKTCSVCSATEGKALGHNWQDATCDTPKTCLRCEKTEGKSLDHSWAAATPTAPKTCERCKLTEGSPLQPCDACENSGKSECSDCNEGIAKCTQCKGTKTLFCSNCAGEKTITCTSCKGSGRGVEQSKKCSGCKGTGYLDFRCYSCGGRGISAYYGSYSTCSTCNGYGYIPLECWICDGRRYTTYYDKCSTCKGKGTIKDPDCQGTGKVSCTACAGEGIGECNACKGALTVSCKKCDGTGWISADMLTEKAELERMHDGTVFLCSAREFTKNLNEALQSAKTIVPGHDYIATFVDDNGDAQISISSTKNGETKNQTLVAELSFAIGGDSLEYKQSYVTNVFKGIGGIVDGTAHSQVVMLALLRTADPTITEADAMSHVTTLTKKNSVQVNELTYQITSKQRNPALILLHLPIESQ